MKKRALAIGSIVALMTLLAGVTMAWFSSTPNSVENKFIAGTVQIEVNEYGFVDINNVNPGDTETKEVSVKSLGSAQTYIRVALIPQWDSISLSTDVVTLNINTTDWVDGGDGWYYYKHIITESQETSLLLNSVTFSGTMGNEYQGKTFTLEVKAEAVQASHEAYKDVWNLTELPIGVQVWVAP